MPDNSLPPGKGLTPLNTPTGRGVPGLSWPLRGAMGALHGAEGRRRRPRAPATRDRHPRLRRANFQLCQSHVSCIKIKQAPGWWGVEDYILLSYLLVLQLLLPGRKLSCTQLRVFLHLFKKQRLGAFPRAPFHPLCLPQSCWTCRLQTAGESECWSQSSNAAPWLEQGLRAP